jgi:hypothetical protein
MSLVTTLVESPISWLRRGPANDNTIPSTTTEVPTFFGPSDSPLFGVLHLPADNEIRGGVLICGSLGREGIESARLHRILADNLARRGFAVLNFHYLGTGDSAYAQVRDDAVANWVASVGHALDYLTLIGAKSATVLGIRAGCLILDEYLTQSHMVNRVVYLDPPGTGKRYLREHTTLFRLSVGEDAATPGEVSIMGGRLSDRAAAEFAQRRMGANPISAYGVDGVLMVGRPAETDMHLTALASAEGVESIVSGGLPDCAHPLPVPLPIPVTAVDSIVDWIDDSVPTATYTALPRYVTTVTMPAEGAAGVDVVERIERIEPNGLFVVRTQPRGPGPAPAKTVLFFVAGHESHVGPNREWVELSRRIAAAGSQALRWDPAQEGLSGQIRWAPWRRVYSRAEIIDSISVARHACQDAGELELVGICSGSWYAAQAARSIGAQSAILVNQVVWNWRVTPTLLEQRYFEKLTLNVKAASETGGSGPAEASPTKPLVAHVRSAQKRTKILMHIHLPRSVLRGLSWVGLAFLPEDVLSTLAHGGTDVTVIASPEDAQQFTALGGQAALDRLQWASQPPRLISAPTGDHSGNHPAILAAIRNAVLPAAAVSPPEHASVSEITSSPNTLVANLSHHGGGVA